MLGLLQNENLDNYTNQLCEFFATPILRQITGGIHVNDALIYDAWQNLPQEWTSWWSTWADHRLAQENLIDSIDENGEAQRQAALVDGRPESLNKWLNTLASLALPRMQQPGPSITLPEALKKEMKSKKISEVSRAVAHIYSMSQKEDIVRIIDMGSGQGYLSVSLAYLYPRLKVLSIDGSDSQVAGSRALAASLGIPEERITHMVRWIDGSLDLAAEIEAWAGQETCMLVGLHACGNLSEHMIRFFTNVRQIEALAVVGCCYNHIVPRSSYFPDGFPISTEMRQRNVSLTPTALMIGSQAPNNWKRVDDATCQKSSVFSRRRSYRAILEKVFYDKGIQLKGRPEWGTRKGDMDSFSQYARRSMDCLGISPNKISTAELVSYEERFGRCQDQIAILWTLGALCWKIVESIIVVDRLWFLKEENQAGTVDVIPVFDVKVSPRNLMIAATKGSSPQHEP